MPNQAALFQQFGGALDQRKQVSHKEFKDSHPRQSNQDFSTPERNLNLEKMNIDDSSGGGRMLGEFNHEISRLREENAQMRYIKEVKERDYESVMFEN